MAQVNDQVLTAIGRSLVQAEQIPPADLLPQIVPVIQTDEYRRDFVYMSGDATPSGGAGVIQFVLETPETEMWRVLFVGIDNLLGTEGIDAEIQVIDAKSPSITWFPARRVISVAQRVTMVGAGGSNFESAENECIPATIEVPNLFQMAVILTSQSPPFDTFRRSCQIVIERVPVDRKFEREDFKNIVVP